MSTRIDDPEHERMQWVLRRYYVLVWRTVFFLSLGALVLGYIKQDDFKHISYINPAVTRDSTQTMLKNAEPIEFVRDGFSYTLEPVAEYEISALVIHRLIYDKWYSLSRTDKAFTVDLCLMWGENMSSGAYAIDSLSVKQDFRFCIYSYRGNQAIHNDSFSNNHIIAATPHVQDVIHKIRPGDQILLKGKLVHVDARRIGNAKTDYEPAEAIWHTSTTREDTGAGACEIMYVEEVTILNTGNVLYRLLFTFGIWGLLLVCASSCVSFFNSLVRSFVRV